MTSRKDKCSRRNMSILIINQQWLTTQTHQRAVHLKGSLLSIVECVHVYHYWSHFCSHRTFLFSRDCLKKLVEGQLSLTHSLIQTLNQEMPAHLRIGITLTLTQDCVSVACVLSLCAKTEN